MREKSERPNIEIERKFLVANDEWRQLAVRSVSIRDGLIAVYKDRKVRVRISGDIATVAIKGPRIGIVRPEFEYEIPIADAERMLSTLCRERTPWRSERFFVEEAGAAWHVDVYGGILQGVVIAEIELKQEGQDAILPRWIGKEVTGDSCRQESQYARACLNGSSPRALVPTAGANAMTAFGRFPSPSLA